MVLNGKGVIGGILSSRASGVMENSGNKIAALVQELSTCALVVGDAMDIMDQGLQISETSWKNIIDQYQSLDANGSMRVKMLRELNGD